MERFSILDWTVERFSKEKICESFYPRESIDGNWFCQQWFLWCSESYSLKPTTIRIFLRPDIIRGHWKPLLILSLYNITTFAVPIVLESEYNWELTPVLSGRPRADIGNDGEEIPTFRYDVRQEEKRRFNQFLRFITSALTTIGNAKFVEIAACRYLRAMFATGPAPFFPTADETEDALLQYVYAMEKLLLAQGENEAISDKIATRCAYLIGLDKDEDRKQIFRAVKDIYNRRSEIVHGSTQPKKKQESTSTSLVNIRDLMRHLLLVSISFRSQFSDDEKWKSDLVVSRKLQNSAAKSAKRAFALIKPSARG